MNVVALAAVSTQNLPGARVSMQMEIVSPRLPGALDVAGRGIVSNNPPVADLRLGLSHVVDASGARVLEVRAVKHVLYLRVLAVADQPMSRWIEINQAREARAAGLEGLPTLNAIDPDLDLTYLRAARGEVTPLGLQTLHGVPTSGYRGEVDLEEVASQASGDRRAASVTAVGNLERGTGVKTIPFQVWIDAAGHVRRMSFTEGEGNTHAGAEKTYITVDFRGFGVERPPRTPPEREVLDVSRAEGAALSAELGLKQ
jgi:hypothetical protein